MTTDEKQAIIVVRDVDNQPDWKEIQLGPDKWAMVRVGGDTIVYKREKALGDIEFEIERLKANGEFANSEAANGEFEND